MHTFEKIKQYYHHSDEWSRLDAPAGQIEKQEVLHILKPYLKERIRILDLGSGPGKYALEFARMGCKLDLVDLSEKLIAEARDKFREGNMENSVGQFSVGNATDISFLASNTYDIVFCCGPFYHLVEEKDRIMAAREIIRVCKKGGIIAIGFIPRFSALAGILNRAAGNPDQVDASVFREIAESGIFRNKSMQGFQEGYFPTLSEMKKFWTDLKLHDIKTVSSRGFIYQNETVLMKIKSVNHALYETVIETHRDLADKDTYVEAGGHALLIGKK
ncbi:MAG: class I SAM-dependent methyltransferase [Saprospiraceae bacterium]|nr:class I SAM-dependent methyltransferase [Saprospiraceae bacterium]